MAKSRGGIDAGLALTTATPAELRGCDAEVARLEPIGR